jgi:hypothetical protein
MSVDRGRSEVARRRQAGAIDPGCVKSRAQTKCGEKISSKMHFRMRKERAATAENEVREQLSALSVSGRVFTQPGPEEDLALFSV